VYLHTEEKLSFFSQDLQEAFSVPLCGCVRCRHIVVIFLAGFAPTEVFMEAYVADIKNNHVGAKGFAFGCRMGFSDRIIMPKVK